ncbi:MAG TPA: M67 family metallopeptidase [Gemmatimonadales bacterium]|nr:M67 family metallopeptidase [Gemmatimonadales bacterium]
MTLRIGAELLDRIRRQAERAYPAECCGAIAGRPAPLKEAVRLFPLRNRRTDDPRRYLIDADQLRRVDAAVRAAGWEIIGFYHSHPDHPPEPSAYDVEHAWPWYSYLIAAVERGRADRLASWVLADDRSAMRPEALEVPSEV